MVWVFRVWGFFCPSPLAFYETFARILTASPEKKQEILPMRGQKFHFNGNLDSPLSQSPVNIPFPDEKKKPPPVWGGGKN